MMMLFRDNVHSFGMACERILSPAIMKDQLTEEEAAMIEYYCLELLAKIAPLLSQRD